MAWVPFTYREFYDIPRAILVEWGGRLYFLDCPFDSARDDYPDQYTVYRIPADVAGQLDRQSSWQDLPIVGEPVGRIPIPEIEFDPTKREAIDDRVFKVFGG